MTEFPKVTVAIKAYNEAGHIAASVQSAKAALERAGGGEVLVVDLGSSDRTPQAALQAGARVVRLTDPKQRRWGVGPAIAFESAEHDYIYILDGDMEMRPDFLAQALPLFSAKAPVGVGGRIVEAASDAATAKLYAKKLAKEARAQQVRVRMLEGGGLYDRARCKALGELPNAAIITNEEAEFGYRLAAKGGQLLRLPIPAAVHHGDRKPGFGEFRAKWNSKYYFGPGQVLRASFGTKAFWWHVRRLRLYLGVLAWWLVGVACLGATLATGAPEPLLVWLGLSLAFILSRLILKGPALGVYSLVSWKMASLGLLLGLFVPAKPFSPSFREFLSPQRPVR